MAARGLTRRSLVPSAQGLALLPALASRVLPPTLPSSSVCSRSAKRFYNSLSSLETPRLTASAVCLSKATPSSLTTFTGRRRINNNNNLSSTVFRRHCSHQRNMCIRGVDIDQTSTTAGREILPTNVIPTNYDLTLEPNFSDFTFDGTVTIK